MKKKNFKGSVMLNPTPVVVVTSKNKEDKVNAFTVGYGLLQLVQKNLS